MRLPRTSPALAWAMEYCLVMLSLDGPEEYRTSCAPGGEARQPAGDVGAVGLVFVAEGVAEGGLLVGQDEEMEAEPDGRRVLQEAQVAEQEGLAEDQGHHR